MVLTGAREVFTKMQVFIQFRNERPRDINIIRTKKKEDTPNACLTLLLRTLFIT